MIQLKQFLLGPSFGAPAEDHSYSETDIKIKEAVERIFQNQELTKSVEAGFARILKSRIQKTDDLDFLRTAFLKYPEHANQLALAIEILRAAGILSPVNRERLLHSPAYAEQLARGLVSLTFSFLFEEDNLEILFQAPQYAEELAHGLASLDDSGILLEIDRSILLQHPEHAHRIAEAMGILASRELLTEEIINCFLLYPSHSLRLACAIVNLQLNNLLTENNRRNLLQDPEHSEELAEGLRMLAIDRANEIAEEVLENVFVDLYITGEDVHTRDQKVRAAIEDLQMSQGAVVIDLQPFKNFLLKQESSPKIEAALYAMEGAPKPGEDFPALIGLQDPWAISGLQIEGEELLSRLWLYTTQIEDAQNKENAQLSMIYSLADSFDDHGHRVCNPGKAGRLVTGVLQGNVPGLVFDEVDNPKPITPEPAVGLFFLLPEHQEIDNLADLLSRAKAWLEENPLVIDPERFLALLEEFANHQDLPKEKII